MNWEVFHLIYTEKRELKYNFLFKNIFATDYKKLMTTAPTIFLQKDFELKTKYDSGFY